jgi:hypothetical protein
MPSGFGIPLSPVPAMKRYRRFPVTSGCRCLLFKAPFVGGSVMHHGWREWHVLVAGGNGTP